MTAFSVRMGEYMNKRTSSGRRKRRSARQFKRTVVLVSTVLLLMTGMMAFRSMTLQAKNNEYKSQEAELNQEIEKEKERSSEVKEYQEYVQSDEYVKDVAREKLGLVDPDEIVFEPAE